MLVTICTFYFPYLSLVFLFWWLLRILKCTCQIFLRLHFFIYAFIFFFLPFTYSLAYALFLLTIFQPKLVWLPPPREKEGESVPGIFLRRCSSFVEGEVTSSKGSGEGGRDWWGWQHLSLSTIWRQTLERETNYASLWGVKRKSRGVRWRSSFSFILRLIFELAKENGRLIHKKTEKRGGKTLKNNKTRNQTVC